MSFPRADWGRQGAGWGEGDWLAGAGVGVGSPGFALIPLLPWSLCCRGKDSIVWIPGSSGVETCHCKLGSEEASGAAGRLCAR